MVSSDIRPWVNANILATKVYKIKNYRNIFNIYPTKYPKKKATAVNPVAFHTKKSTAIA